MGMSDAFIRPKADFSGLNGIRETLHFRRVSQSLGEINEEGTEAAAATAQLIALGCDEGPPSALRPFSAPTIPLSF